jgi:peptidoglycan hydrolase CwlO-like protein
LEQLIEARAAQQNFSSQLATKVGQIQQLACDRDLALQKLCHSEEKLVELEAQLVSLEGHLQDRQEGLAAQVAALDVAAMAAGPLAGELLLSAV